MDEKFRNKLILEGEIFEGKKLKNFLKNNISNNQLPKWKQEVFQFVQEWISDVPTIEANTSGTTGTPKKILLEKKRMVASAQNTGQYFKLKKNEKALLCLPVKYIAGKMMVVRAFVLGLDLWLAAPSGNPLEDIDFDEMNFAAMVPLQVFNSFQNSIELNRLRKIKKTIIGGGAVSSTLHNFLKKEKNQFFATYGMTETITHIAVKKLNGSDASENYETLAGIGITIDSRSCLTINAPAVANQEIITNDVVEIISEGKFQWLGRFDNIINTGSVKVVPEAVEKVIGTFLEERFFISSLPDERLGSRLVLIIEGAIFSEKKQKNLQGFLNLSLEKNLSTYEIPKETFFIEKFVETPTGKIQREKTMDFLLGKN